MATKIVTDKFENYQLLKFKNEIEQNDFYFVIESVDKIIENGHSKIILDFSEISFLSSSAIKAIIKTFKTLKLIGGNLLILIEGQNYHTLIKTKLDSVIPCFTNIEAIKFYIND